MKGLKAESIGASSTDGPSIAARERAAWQKASSRVIDLLQRLGPHSAVHRECYGAGGSVNGELLETLLRVVGGKLIASAVDSYCKEVGKYLDWLVGIRQFPVEVGPVTLCGYLRASLSRGSSVPTKVRAALCWCESHIKVLLGATGVEVRDFTEQLGRTSPGGLVKEKDQAPPLPVDFVVALEGLVGSAHTLPLRIFAGVCCLCTHGVKRWADVQHVLRMSSTDDGLMVTTYRSKRKERPFLWAALRLGFGAGDCVTPFFPGL